MPVRNDILHIFILDDDEFLLATLKRSLENSGYKVTTSNNVHDAYFKLNFLSPDIIMIDVIMPDINGFEFLSLLHSPEDTLDPTVILMSYLPEKEIKQMGFDPGKITYMEKPFNFNALPLKLKKVFSKNKRHLTSTSSF